MKIEGGMRRGLRPKTSKASMRVPRGIAVTAPAGPAASDPAHRRRLLADFCKLLGVKAGQQAAGPPKPLAAPVPLHLEPGLPPRLRQTLSRLLSGDSEKQIAIRFNLSPHTVHAYVKSLHKRYGVCSRGELLARFIANPPVPRQ